MAIGTASWIANKRGSVQTRGTTNREKACRGRARKLNNRSVHHTRISMAFTDGTTDTAALRASFSCPKIDSWGPEAVLLDVDASSLPEEDPSRLVWPSPPWTPPSPEGTLPLATVSLLLVLVMAPSSPCTLCMCWLLASWMLAGRTSELLLLLLLLLPSNGFPPASNIDKLVLPLVLLPSAPASGRRFIICMIAARAYEFSMMLIGRHSRNTTAIMTW
mmetsp:Transcript_32583/g.97230  ORF Transcript_32583/g.97230 Transcript_32583/m.97230 type:complete len:218 (+) Transcript_32583:1996-2649(+)